MTGVSTVLGWSLLHFLWQGAVIGLAGTLALRLLRSSTPSIRYLVACGTLALMLAAPVGTALSATGLPAVFAPPVTPPVARGADSAPAAAAVAVAAPAGAHGALAPGRIRENDRLVTVLVVLWVCGVGVMALRLAGGWLRVRRIHRRALRAQPSPWQAVAERVASRLGLRRAVTVVESAEQPIPMLVGWRRPVITLPVACVAGLSPRQVEAILAHELAHVRRHDLLVNLLQSIAETLLFYHPAVWWISARIREEREYCCDDAAVQACGDPGEYVEALVQLEALRPSSGVFVAAATDGPLVARARRLLVPRDVPRGQPAAIVAVLFLVILTAGTLAQAGLDSPPAGRRAQPAWTAETPIIAVTVAATAYVPSARDEVDGARGELQDAGPAAARAGITRVHALVFDLASLAPDHLHASRLAALQFVDAQMAEGELMTIFSFADGIEVVADLTSDRDTLRTALHSLESAVAPSATDAPRLAPLGEVCEALEPVQGTKRVLLLTAGAGAGGTTVSGLRNALNSCRRANAAIFPIDARGLSVVRDPAGTPGGQLFRRP